MGEPRDHRTETAGRSNANRAWAASDPAGWLDRYGDVLFRYAWTRVRDRELAEELVQETLVAAFRGREQFSGKSAEQTWLIGILRRKIVDHVRRVSRERSAEEPAVVQQMLAEAFDERGIWRAPLKRWPRDPAQTLEQREFWDVFDGCLSRLPPALLNAFSLREMERLETDEVCKILGITPSNLWTQLHRARLLLRRCLEVRWFGGQV